MAATVLIEDCTEDHMSSVQSIYAHYVGSSLATFETDAPTLIQMLSRRMDTIRSGQPYIVAVRDGEVIGYAYSGAYRPRPAYRHTVENSVYVAADSHGMGVGRQLLRALIASCEARGFQQMVAVIGDSGNAASIGLHHSAGFRHVGVLRNVGHKFGRWIDTVLMQRELTPAAPPEHITFEMDTRG